MDWLLKCAGFNATILSEANSEMSGKSHIAYAEKRCHKANYMHDLELELSIHDLFYLDICQDLAPPYSDAIRW